MKRLSSPSFRVLQTLWLIAGLAIAGFCTLSVAGEGEGKGAGGRSLLGIRETQGNVSFHCSTSGPCIRCQYSEKNDEKYRCSETGYRVPLRCEEIVDGSKQGDSNKGQRKLLSYMLEQEKYHSRQLLDVSLTSESGKQSYITYRSCLPAEPQERLSVLGFEVIMVCLLLLSGSMVYMRQKRFINLAGFLPVRVSNNSFR